jgi:uncharacterized protein (DUF488 family)
MKTIYSIGHSRHEPDIFMGLLKKHDISAVYDVRSRPYSKFLPQFRRDNLRDILREVGIAYVYIGDKLGGKPRPAPALFEEGLNILRADADNRRLAIMCAEKEPLNCHRTWTIAQNLPDMEVVHILADGRLERHVDLMASAGPKQMALGF